MMQDRHFINTSKVWENDFSKTFITSLKGTYVLKKWGLSIGAAYHLLNNAIYYDSLSMPIQDGTTGLGQLRGRHEMQIWNFHLYNELYLQGISGDAVKLPQVYSRHSLSWKLRIRRLRLQPGAALTFASPYQGETFFTGTGQFHRQNDFEFFVYPTVDLFVNFQVDQLRAFIKMDNINAYWFSPTYLYYEVAEYPYPFQQIRFGISWYLFN